MSSDHIETNVAADSDAANGELPAATAPSTPLNGSTRRPSAEFPTEVPAPTGDAPISPLLSVSRMPSNGDMPALDLAETKDIDVQIPVDSGVPVEAGAGAGAPPSEPAPKMQTCCGEVEYGTQPWHLMPYTWDTYKKDLPQIKDEIIAGVTVAFAQVSESIAFAFIAGVGPLLGLHAAWIIGLSLSFFGSRPGMINGATGVRAAVLAPYVKEYGIGYLFYIVFVISIFQLAAGLLKLAKFVRMVPRPVMIGFVNGLAIILTLGQVFQFQIPCSPPPTSMTRPVPAECQGANPPKEVMIEGSELAFMFLHVALVFVTIKLIPKIPKVGKYIPASLTGILLSTFVEWAILRPSGERTPVIGEVGTVSGGLPSPFFTDAQYEGKLAPFNWETIKVCIMPAFIAAAAGAVEAVMTMEVVNDKTDTVNEAPNQQLIALSIGNAVSAIYGTMGGGATIGLSVINVENGANGRYRISGVVAGITVLVFVLVAAPLIEIVPTASLVGVMVVVILSTFDWESLMIILASSLPRSCRRHSVWGSITRSMPFLSSSRKIRRVDAVVIVLVTVVTLVQDLFVAVMAGVLLTAAAFTWSVGERISVETQVKTVKVVAEDGEVSAVTKKIYRLHGPLFFASAQRFATLFDPKNDPDVVEVYFDRDGTDLSDYSGIHALNVVGEKYHKYGKHLYVCHLDERSKNLVRKASKLQRHFTLAAGATDLWEAEPTVARVEVAESPVPVL